MNIVGNLEILNTGDTWGKIKGIAYIPSIPAYWVSKMAKQARKAIPIVYSIRSNPSKQVLYIDKEYKRLTPRDFSAFKVKGHQTSIEVHFKKPIGLCRRRILTIKTRNQLIDVTLKPVDPENPTCESELTSSSP